MEEVAVESELPAGGGSWFAVRVRSRHEKVVEASLKGKGYHTFLPVFRDHRKWGRRSAEVECPLFPGYVFAELEFHRRLPILQTAGVVQFVCNGHLPAPVDPAELAAIRAVSLSGLPVAPWPFLEAGQRVRVGSGALSGVEGVLLHVKNRDRIVVTLSLLQRSLAVELDRAAIVPIGPKRAQSGLYWDPLPLKST
jgi:transcription antitermination factor NusG